jgi:hypothetical protein
MMLHFVISAASSNDISHVGFAEAWAKEYGKIVYQG